MKSNKNKKIPGLAFRNQADTQFNHEPDSSVEYWSNLKQGTLPQPDNFGMYSRNKPLKVQGIENKKAYIVGSGIGGLAAAFYLIRDGHMPGENIVILESADIDGGSMDGAGNAEDGFIVRGGREMNWNYDNLWDLFQDVQAEELPDGHSVLDEYRAVNDFDPNYSNARLMHKQGEVKKFSEFGLTKRHQLEVIKLLLKRKEDLDNITIEEFFSETFLETDFWMFFRTMFAFQNWQSLLEMKLYMHRFLDSIDGFNNLSALVFPKYNQYDTFIKPLTKMLKKEGVQFQFNTQVYDLDIEITENTKIVKNILTTVSTENHKIKIEKNDLVFALTGSMTANTKYGDMDNIPKQNSSSSHDGWTLWKNLANKDPVFGKPEAFSGNPEKSAWESATLTCKPSALIEKLKEVSVNDPYSGRTVTGGIITFTDSNWILSLTCNRQPHFPEQEDDTLVLWLYSLSMDTKGNYIKKAMPECTGREILQELCFHFGVIDKFEDIVTKTKVRTAFMPYITSQFMPRATGDRPRVVPAGCQNLALVGQYVETNNDVIFTMEASVRTARIGVYKLLNLPKQVPDISPTQYDIRNLIKGARVLNNNKPFFGERFLHRILDKTYYAHILPPLPEEEASSLTKIEDELEYLALEGSKVFKSWTEKLLESFKNIKR